MADVKLADYADAKADIGLDNVDNTADASKPVSVPQAAAIAAAKAEAIAASDPAGSAAAAQSAASLDATTKANAAQAASAPIAHVGNVSNPHSVTQAQVGLGSVDNTSDLAKPISTATAAALAGKAATSHTHTTANVTGLDTALATKVASDTIDTLLEITQAAYDALGTKDPATLYVVIG